VLNRKFNGAGDVCDIWFFSEIDARVVIVVTIGMLRTSAAKRSAFLDACFAVPFDVENVPPIAR
jgi:hypothetical protein